MWVVGGVYVLESLRGHLCILKGLFKTVILLHQPRNCLGSLSGLKCILLVTIEVILEDIVCLDKVLQTVILLLKGLASYDCVLLGLE